jgi:hypothetical protein
MYHDHKASQQGKWRGFAVDAGPACDKQAISAIFNHVRFFFLQWKNSFYNNSNALKLQRGSK